MSKSDYQPGVQPMPRKRSAAELVEEIQDGSRDCDSALEKHLHENYRGALEIPSFPDVLLALCCFNMGWLNRVLDLRDGTMDVAEIIREFDLEPFLPLFDRHDDAVFKKGDVVHWGMESWGQVCRVIGRRQVTQFALPRVGDWELFIESLDGESLGFVDESEVNLVGDGEDAGSGGSTDNGGA